MAGTPAPGDAPPAVQLVGVTKKFGEVVAVDAIDLSIAEGEFFSLLGPSGSGKTTVLRMIAGFELPSAGTVLLQGDDVTNVAPYHRDLNTVFQDYALFPHMTLQRNVEYGLKVKGVGRAERRRRAGEILESVRLSGMADRRPDQLSGGQRQRVALARALVNRPKVLLLDEPLGALDLKLREEMQTELKAIQREVGITFVFVTHDQDEALSMSSRIAVFNAGRIEQAAEPRALYEQPATTFVATFVGTSNVFSGEQSQRLLGRPGTHALRPERLTVGARSSSGSETTVECTVTDVQYLGAECRMRLLTTGGDHLIATLPSHDAAVFSLGSHTTATWATSAVYEVADTGRAVDVSETAVVDSARAPQTDTTVPAAPAALVLPSQLPDH